jgi:nitrate reductase alpha subunit
MERGGKIVAITPDYSAPATKADYWIGVRAGLSDLSIFLYLAKYLIDQKLYDIPFIQQFTDFPLLVRTDTLKRLRPQEVIADYQLANLKQGPSYRIQGLTDDQREQIGDWMVFDQGSGQVRPLNRDQVGQTMNYAGLEPALEWRGTVQ